MKDRSYRDKTFEVDVAVIGAGASGLMAAISAARAGVSVAVLEHTAVSAKKILSTGNGRCNFTNAVMTEECYRSDDSSFVMTAISRFSERDAVTFFEDLGVLAKSRNGYYYPRSGQATAIRDALIAEARRLGIRFIYKAEIKRILCSDVPLASVVSGDREQYAGGRFRIEYNGGENMILAGRSILACGGMAAPKTGSDGSAYALVKELGHTVQTPLPALVPLISSEKWLAAVAGVRCDARVLLYTDKEKVAEDIGELQFTDYGISGIPVFQISRYAAVALSKGQRVTVSIDFLPEVSAEQLSCMMEKVALGCGEQKNWRQIISGFCNQKVAAVISEASDLADCSVCSLTKKQIRKQISVIVRHLKETNVRITGTRSMEQAQVTCGGVLLREIAADMQSRLVPGLYFAGEILNVDGI